MAGFEREEICVEVCYRGKVEKQEAVIGHGENVMLVDFYQGVM